MRLVVCHEREELAETAARLFRDRVRAKPDLAMAVPAGRSPRRMYGVLARLQQAEPVDFSCMRVFCVDELCPPAPPDGYFWRQIRRELLAWAGVSPERCHPFRVDAPMEPMCREYEATIAGVGGLDLVMLGLGPNGHLAANEPGSSFESRTRPVTLRPESFEYMLSDKVRLGPVSDRAVTLGLATILEAREVVVLAVGAAKRTPLKRALEGPVSPDLPASILQLHRRCTVLADPDAIP